jgi:DNA-binding CsgD family transcriptional regulator
MTANNMLSDRERDILKELEKGATYKEVGNNLYISENTVRTHVRHIYEKLEANNRTRALTNWKNG